MRSQHLETVPQHFDLPHLFDDQATQDVHDETDKARVDGHRLNDGAHQEGRNRRDLHQLVKNDGQHFLIENLLLLKAQRRGFDDDFEFAFFVGNLV